MTILGIDPGNTHSAAVVLDDGKLNSSCRLPNPEFLEWLQSKKMVHSAFNGEAMQVTCEMIAPMGMAVGPSIFDTCVQIGRIQAIFPDMDRVTRPAVKGCLLRSGAGNDAAIRKRLISIYGEPGTKKRPGGTFGLSGDMWAALAVATVASMGCRLYETMGQKRRKKKITPKS